MANKPTTGRFANRKQLEAHVLKKASLKKPWSFHAIANDANVSWDVVRRIVTKAQTLAGDSL